MKAKKLILALLGTILLVGFTGYVLLDTFVIVRTYASVESPNSSTTETESIEESTAALQANEEAAKEDHTTAEETTEDQTPEEETTAEETAEDQTIEETTEASAEPVVTANSYSDENISITINEYEVYGTAVYVADIQVSSAEYLKTAFANDIFGRNVTAATSEIAADNNAILAINGDFYGSSKRGYVLKNGTAYRDTSAGNQEDLVIWQDGSFEIINESETSLAELVDAGAWQLLSFGPAIVENGEIAVSEDEEVGQAMASNPRTAIGIIDELHYVFVVSDGRTDESAGLSLSELGEVMQALGCTTAYNLDGGGSSTMVFNGQVINNPTSGHKIKERSVSDIVYIG